jgi:predicted ArsR family transcriptional regulator
MTHDGPDDQTVDGTARRGPDDVLAAVAALGDPLRRRLYRFVEAQDHAVSRDEVAEGAGVSRSAAAFHLDRLVHERLLETEFRRLTGRQGPGAGRPAKLYRRAAGEVAVSLPARRYELAAGLLAGAAEATAGGEPVLAAIDRLARVEGARIAAGLPPGGAGPGPPGTGRVADALAAQGYEARAGAGHVTLANCPFAALAARHPALTCTMNLALLQGFSAALAGAGVSAHLRPAEGRCCVVLDVAGP